MNKLSNTLFFTLGLAFIPAAFATDGVIEINHARALAGGITLGDTAGYPVTISQSGSYRLTGDLVQSDPDVTVILANPEALNVNIDLNGFTIRGLNVCSTSGVPPVTNCSHSGSGYGIRIGGETAFVGNGTVTGTGNTGIMLSGQSRIANLHVSHCGGQGVSLVSHGTAVGINARSNRQEGIFAYGGTISASFASENGSDGISLGNDGGVISSSMSFNNVGAGINLMEGAVSGNTVSRNRGAGIMATYGVVSGNFVRNNVRYGLWLTSTAYSNNSVVENAEGSVSGGINTGGNHCNPACP